MLEQWLTPLLSWLGIGLIPFLILVLILVIIIRGD